MTTIDLSRFVTQDSALTQEGKEAVSLAFAVLKLACHGNALAHGWYDNVPTPADRNFSELTSLLHTEISEAYEAYREGDDYRDVALEWPESLPSGKDRGAPVVPKPVGVASEFADVIIRLFDTVGALDIPLTKAVIEKHHYNQTRPYRHGGKLA